MALKPKNTLVKEKLNLFIELHRDMIMELEEEAAILRRLEEDDEEQQLQLNKKFPRRWAHIEEEYDDTDSSRGSDEEEQDEDEDEDEDAKKTWKKIQRNKLRARRYLLSYKLFDWLLFFFSN